MSTHEVNTPSPVPRQNPYNVFPDLAPDEDGPVEVNYVTDPATECVQCLRCHGCRTAEDEPRGSVWSWGDRAWPRLRIFP